MTKETSSYNQSAVIPLRWKKDKLQLLLVTSRRGRRWVIPKGIIEPDLTPGASAEKEAYEEAGIQGNLFPQSIGCYKYSKWGGVCQVEVFGLMVTKMLKKWPEADFRKRTWFFIPDAIEIIEEPELKLLFKKLPELIEASGRPKF